MSAVPKGLRNGIIALVILAGGGAGLYYEMYQDDSVSEALLEDPYIKAVARDATTSNAVKIAMVMGYYYESSNRVITKPYNDKYGAVNLGRSTLWTVCNGITDQVLPKGKTIDFKKVYTPDECYQMEKGAYQQAEKQVINLFKYWNTYNDYEKAVFIDFRHNKKYNALVNSTLLKKANLGDLRGACMENPRWKFAGSVVLPGLEIRGNSNEEICLDW